MDPEKTWVPAALELSMALYAIVSNFDPYRYFLTSKKHTTKSYSKELEAQKIRLDQETKRQKFHRMVIDELVHQNHSGFVGHPRLHKSL